jgi:hypothetical protein
VAHLAEKEVGKELEADSSENNTVQEESSI